MQHAIITQPIPLPPPQQIVSSINKAYSAIAKKKMDIQKQADKILELVDDFKFLSAQTGVKDVETLIPILLQSEEENFRLFDATNEYNKELESLEVERGAIRVDIAKVSERSERALMT